MLSFGPHRSQGVMLLMHCAHGVLSGTVITVSVFKCGWVGPSKHNCCRIVFCWLDDDYMFWPCSAIFRS